MKYDMSDPINKLAGLEKAAKEAESTVKKLYKEMQNTSDVAKKSDLKKQWQDAKVEADKATKSVEQHRKATDVTSMSYQQLKNYADKLNKAIAAGDKTSKSYVDNLKRLGEVETEMKKTVKQANELKKAGENLSLTWKDKVLKTFSDLGIVGVAGMAALGAAVKSAFTFITDSFIDFDQAAADTKGELNLTTEEIAKLKEEAKQTGPQFAKTAKEMLDAYNEIGSGKSELVKTKNGLQDVTNAAVTLSLAGGIGMKESATLLTESLNQYQAEAKESAKYVDILATGVQVGAAKIDSLTESLKYVGPVAKASNVSFTETNALLQVLARNGLKGEQAGTSLRGTLLNLAKQADSTINPAIVGVQTAMENLAKKNLTAAQMSELVGTTNVVAALALSKSTPLIREFTKAIEAGGGASTMLADKTNTLKFQISQARAIIINYAVSIGEKLAPIMAGAIRLGLAFLGAIASIPKFVNENKVAIGGLVLALITFNAHLIQSNAQILYNAAVTKGKLVWDKATTLTTYAMTVAQTGLNTAMKANPIGLVIAALIGLGTILYEAYQRSQTVRAGFAGLFAAMKEGAAIISRMWTALKNLDFKAIATEMATATLRMGLAFTAGYAEKVKSESKKTVASVKKDNAEQVKSDEDKNTKLGKGIGELSDKQKKAVDDRKKAHEEALKKIAELEQDAKLEHIRQMEGEAAYEKAKLQGKFEEEKVAIQKSLANQNDKATQLRLIEAKLDKDLAKLEEQNQKTTADIIERYTDETLASKIKKAQSFADKELENARKHITDTQVLAGIEKKINEQLKADIEKIKADQAAAIEKKAEDSAKKQFDMANKRLANEQFILEQEQKAEIAVLDGLELAHRKSKSKLVQLQKERLDTELKQFKDKIALEQKIEELKIKQDIKDETERNQALGRLNEAYRTREKEETSKTEQAKVDIEKKKLDERQKMREGFSNAFGALLKGDMLGFVNHLEGIVQGEKAAWQKRLDENMGKFQMIGQLAVQAANFLNDLTQKRVAREIEATKAEFDAKKAMLDASLQAEKDAIEQAENAKKSVKEQYSQQVKDIKEANEKSISDAEQFYSNLSSADANESFAEQVALANSEANEKIAATKKAQSEAEQAARSERDERIISANAAKNAEIAAINERADFDSATKKRLIDEAKAKAEQEIMLAKSEAEQKIQLSKEEKEKKLADAKEEKEAKIKLLEQLKTATKEQAKELLDQAKADAEAKVKAAEKEKNAKLTILAEEKAKREVSKRELERTLGEEDRKAKNKESQLKYQAAMSQWKTDQVTAGVNGALAIIKAFATGGPILGIILAAITGIATGIQIAAIRKNRPPAPASFAIGGFAPTGGIGGLPQGPTHGAKYGDAGLAIVNRKSGKEEGEMEGGEAIISRDQTEANLPLIQQMWAKARRKDKTPVSQRGFRPLAFAYGGMMPSLGNREMFLFGSKKRKAAAAEQEAAAAADMGGADMEGIDTAAAQAAQEQAQKNAEAQTKLMEEMRDGLKLINETLGITNKHTANTVAATQEVKKAVEASNANNKLEGVIGAISSWGKK